MIDPVVTDHSNSETTETPEVDHSQNEWDKPERAPEVIDKKRHAEILKWKEKQLEEAQSTLADFLYKTATTTDVNILKEFRARDPKLVDKVGSQLDFSWTKWGTYQNFLDDKVAKTEDDFDAKYNERRSKEIHEAAIKKAEKVINKIPEDVREKAQSYFEKITDWKRLTEDDAIEYAEMATLYVQKGRKQDVDEAVADLAWGPVSWRKAWNETYVTVVDPISGKRILIPKKS